MQRFQTEELYDFVWIDDGSIDDATCEQGGRELPDGCLAIMSGELRDQTAREFRSSGDELLIRFKSDSSIGGEGFETSYECVSLGGGAGDHDPSGHNYVTPSVQVMSASMDGYTTVQMVATLDPDTSENVYTLFGTPTSRLNVPPAFQVSSPFGTDIGGVNPALLGVMAEAQFDSWLT